MVRKMLMATLFVASAFALVLAGDMEKGATGNSPMEAMKTEMMKCFVCKNVAMHMDEIGPMGMQSVKLNDGVAITHWAKSEDPKKLAAFHAACDACNKAGEATMSWPDAQAKTDLCEFCQEMRAASKAGARMSMGRTKNGDMMVLTASDADVQARLASLHDKCTMMIASMETPAQKASAQKE